MYDRADRIAKECFSCSSTGSAAVGAARNAAAGNRAHSASDHSSNLVATMMAMGMIVKTGMMTAAMICITMMQFAFLATAS